MTVGQTPRSARDALVPLFAALYAAALLALLTVKPLWLDEIIELRVTSGPWSATLQQVAETPGGSPLGYAGQWLLRSMGASAMWASRLPSAIAGVGALIAFLFLCRKLMTGRAAAVLAGILWCICPLALRYSLEGRPYMQGTLFSILAVLAQIRLSQSASLLRSCALAAFLAAAMYSQPFAVFAPLVFSAWDAATRRDPKYTAFTTAAYGAAILAYLPWFLTVRHYWSESVLPNRGAFHISAYLFLTLLRESVGDGYPAAISAILAAVYGSARHAWAAVLGATALVLAADAKFHYFFAARQIIYVLPFLLILMSSGLIRLWTRPRYRPAAVVLGTVFAAAALAKDYRHVADHTEDWVRLSRLMADKVGGGCILSPATHEAPLFSLVQPKLMPSLCGSRLRDRVIVPFTIYTDSESRQEILDELKAAGFDEVSSTAVGFATVKIFDRGRQ